MTTKLSNITALPDLQGQGISVSYSEDISALVSRHISELEQDAKNEARRRNGQPIPFPLTLDNLFHAVYVAVKSKELADGVPEGKGVLFSEEDPTEEEILDTPAITYYLKSTVPGKFERGSTEVGRIQERTPHIRGISQHLDKPSEKLVTMGQFVEARVVFNVWGRTNKETRKRLEWFQSLMSSFHWWFRYSGFQVLEEGSGEREHKKIGELTLVKYPTTFFVRFDKIFTYSVQQLKNINIVLSADTD